MLALGSGDAELEARLAAHLVIDPPRHLDLCLLDLSFPLLAAGYRYATQMLAAYPGVRVYAAHIDFHDLPRYPELLRVSAKREAGRLVCMLGGTFGSLTHARQFLQQSLLLCGPGDWLLLDVPIALASFADPEALKRKDKLYADGLSPGFVAWLGGPIWRHHKGVAGVEFTLEPEPFGSIPGSYALNAVARVTSSQGPERRFALYRFGRYDLAELSACLRGMGWDEAAAIPYAGDHALMLYRKT
jgi:hypothetical protein